MNITSGLKQLGRILVSGLIIGLVWLHGATVSTAMAVPILRGGDTPKMAQLLDDSLPILTEQERIEAIAECLPPQFTYNKNETIGDRFARAWKAMGNDQLQRAFNLKANPKLSDAELQLERCLERRAITPQRKLERFIN